MRVVNLSSRPFLNRRPVARIARLLWLVGVLLLALNVWLYTVYFSGTTKNRERLAELGSEIDAAVDQLEAIGRRLKQVDLGGRNARAAYLNELIDQRTFPWSRLFDDLEESLPDEIYLTSVTPDIEQEEPTSRGSQRPQRTRMTPRQARENARAQRQGAESQMPTAESINVEETEDLAVVELELRGIARTDEALLDFVDALYRNERFGDPFLSQETRDEKTREITFNIATFYLLPRAEPMTEGESAMEPEMEPKMEPQMGVEPGTTTASESAAGMEPKGAAERVAGAAGDDVSSRTSTQRPRNLPRSSETSVHSSTEGRAPEPHRDVRRPSTADEGGEQGDPTRQPIDATVSSGQAPDLADEAPEREPATAKPPSPELTQPGASATPALRRLGSLSPSGMSNRGGREAMA